MDESGIEARTLMKLIGWPVSLVHWTDWPVPVSCTYAWPSASPCGESYSLVGAEVSDTTLAPAAEGGLRRLDRS